MPIINDRVLVLRYKQLGWTDARIAAKVGITEAQVAQVWQEIEQELREVELNGFQALHDQYHILCQQYQLLGESLKIIAGALSRKVPAETIRLMVPDLTEGQINVLKSKFILLYPFVPVNPAESLQQSLEEQARGN